MENYKRSGPVKAGHANPSDEALLDIIERNVQRLPGNDNLTDEKRERARLGLVGSITSTLAFAGVSLLAAVIMAIFRLVPSSEDSHY